MSQHFYPALVYSAPFGFMVKFPDLPGCAGLAGSVESATVKAGSMLERELRRRIASGESLPQPGLTLLDAPSGTVRILVPIDLDASVTA
jgi:predicted RNase H-like HicB family nuclease